MKLSTLAPLALVLFPTPAHAQPYDVIMRGGTIYDGTGGKPFVGDVAIRVTASQPWETSARRAAAEKSTPAAWPSRPASSTC